MSAGQSKICGLLLRIPWWLTSRGLDGRNSLGNPLTQFNSLIGYGFPLGRAEGVSVLSHIFLLDLRKNGSSV